MQMCGAEQSHLDLIASMQPGSAKVVVFNLGYLPGAVSRCDAGPRRAIIVCEHSASVGIGVVLAGSADFMCFGVLAHAKAETRQSSPCQM
jgi:hypothetical protein